MPIHDWQFWAVTAAMLLSLINLLRQMLPKKDGSPACGNCATGAAACSRPAPPANAGRPSPLRVIRD